MPYAPFHEKFPEIAEKETRTIIVFDDPDLPEGEYGLLESYCDELDCDCRRVFFNVFSWKKKKIEAVIAYGWESGKFYAKWMGDSDPRVIKELKGPALNLSSPQSPLAPALLEKIKIVLQDKNYVDRIKRHYKLFKEAIEKEKPEKGKVIKLDSSKKVGRNEPCPCGSGKKYKKCCGR